MEQLYWIYGPWSGKLAIFARPRGGDWLPDEIRDLKDEGLDAIVSLLTKEEDEELSLLDEPTLCETLGLQFIKFPIDDVSVPTSRTGTLQLVNTLDELLSKGRNVGIHCRAGVGRSGMIAVSLLMMRGFSSGAAMAVVSKARGVIVPQTDEQRAWLIAFGAEFALEVAR